MDPEDKSNSESALSQIKYVTIRSRVLTGVLQTQNKGAIDWGWQSLLAYGCQTLVVVVDPKNVQILQTLNKHKTAVVKVKWAKENYYHDLANPYYPKLASADVAGNIIIWDVVYAKALSNFADGNNKAILEMEWLSYWSAFHEFLAVLHSPYSFIIWNTTNGNKLWKKTYTESLLSFSFDPFDPCNVAFLAQDSILFIDDFTLSKVPSSNGRKFYISNAASMSGSNTNLMNVGSNSSNSTNEDKPWTRERLRRRVRFLVKDDSKNLGKPEDCYHSNECLSLTYHKACRHHLLLLYSKEILIVDLEINQTIGIINLERNGSPYVQIYTCQQRDVLYCLHESGSVSFRVRRRTNSFPVSVSPIDGSAASVMSDLSTLNSDYLDVMDLSDLCDKMIVTLLKNKKLDMAHLLFEKSSAVRLTLEPSTLRALIHMLKVEEHSMPAQEIFFQGCQSGIYPPQNFSWPWCVRIRSYFTLEEVYFIFKYFLIRLTEVVRNPDLTLGPASKQVLRINLEVMEPIDCSDLEVLRVPSTLQDITERVRQVALQLTPPLNVVLRGEQRILEVTAVSLRQYFNSLGIQPSVGDNASQTTRIPPWPAAFSIKPPATLGNFTSTNQFS